MFGITRILVSVVFGAIEFLLLLRLIFKFFVVNVNTPFVSWIYGATAMLVSPFARIFPDLKLGDFVVDFTTLVALIVYSLAGYLVLLLFSYGEPRKYRS